MTIRCQPFVLTFQPQPKRAKDMIIQCQQFHSQLWGKPLKRRLLLTCMWKSYQSDLSLNSLSDSHFQTNFYMTLKGCKRVCLTLSFHLRVSSTIYSEKKKIKKCLTLMYCKLSWWAQAFSTDVNGLSPETKRKHDSFRQTIKAITSCAD